MNREFLVPDLGEGLQDATITSWSVAVGDTVELNQALCTVETNKAEVEIPSPFAGQVLELGGAAGDTLTVGSLLARIDSAQPACATAGPAKNGAIPCKSVLVGYGTDDTMDASRRAPGSPRARAKPQVRKLAADLQVDLDALNPGSGPAGIVTRDDVLAAAGNSEIVGVGGVQAAMARRMTLSHKEIPDAQARVDVDCTAVLQLRDRIRVADAELPVTPFVLILRLVILVLGRHPLLNSTWLEKAKGPQIRRHPVVHLGFGVAARRGLLVPVVRDASSMTTRELARTVIRLVEQARAGTLGPAELSGSTFTVSNFGALGLDDGTPVINYPEAAILGMGSIKSRPAVVDGAVVARRTMSLSCVFDHRVVDGAQAAAFLGDLRSLIEAPESAVMDL